MGFTKPGRGPLGWISLTTVALLLGGCTSSAQSPATTEAEPASTVAEPASTVAAQSELDAAPATLRAAAERIDLALLIEPMFVDAGSGTRLEGPAEPALREALVAVDWISLVADTDGLTASNLLRSLLGVLRPPGTLASSAGDTVAPASSGERSTFRTLLMHAEAGEDGTTASGDVETSVDRESGKETTTFTVDSTGRNATTGAEVGVRIEGQRTRDLCWSEDGTRQSSTTTTTTVARETDGSATETTITTSTSATFDPSGAINVSASVTQDGYTATMSKGTDSLPSGESDTVTYDDGRYSASTTLEDGTSLTVSWEGDFDQAKFDTALETFEKMASGLAEAIDDELENLKKPLNDSSPGGNEYCIRLTLDPTTAQIGPDGEKLVITATITDWAERPLVAAVVNVGGARLGSVAPTIGTATSSGEWQTTYTSGDSGVEKLKFTASRFGFGVERTATITIASGLAIQWSDTKFGQTATFDAYSCDGAAWTGTFSFSGSPGGAELDMATEFGFETAAGHAEFEIINTGTMGVGSTKLSIQMPYSVTVDIDDQVGAVGVVMTRQSDTVTVEGFTINAGAFPEFTFNVPLTSATECP